MTFDRELSRLARANTKSDSIRTTIPKKIVNDLRLDVNDVLEWRIDTEKGEKSARVKRLKWIKVIRMLMLQIDDEASIKRNYKSDIK